MSCSVSLIATCSEKRINDWNSKRIEGQITENQEKSDKKRAEVSDPKDDVLIRFVRMMLTFSRCSNTKARFSNKPPRLLPDQ